MVGSIVNNPENCSEKANKNDKWTWEHFGLFLSRLYARHYSIERIPLKQFFILWFEGTAPVCGLADRADRYAFWLKNDNILGLYANKTDLCGIFGTTLNSFNLSQPFQIPLTVQNRLVLCQIHFKSVLNIFRFPYFSWWCYKMTLKSFIKHPNIFPNQSI